MLTIRAMGSTLPSVINCLARLLAPSPKLLTRLVAATMQRWMIAPAASSDLQMASCTRRVLVAIPPAMWPAARVTGRTMSVVPAARATSWDQAIQVNVPLIPCCTAILSPADPALVRAAAPATFRMAVMQGEAEAVAKPPVIMVRDPDSG